MVVEIRFPKVSFVAVWRVAFGKARQVAREKVDWHVDVTASAARGTDGDSRGGAGRAAEAAMEEATEETEAAAAAAAIATATARRGTVTARYAHKLIVYELQFEHSARRQSAPAIE